MPTCNLRASTAATALVIALALTGCAPGPKTNDAVAPAPAATATPSQPDDAVQGPPAMGKRAAPPPGQTLGPFIGFTGGGEGWRIELFNSAGLDYRTTLSWDDGARRGEGMLTYRPTADGTDQRKLLDGRLDGPRTDVQLIEGDCTGGDGITRDHSVIVTVDGMPPLRGCGDIAL